MRPHLLAPRRGRYRRTRLVSVASEADKPPAGPMTSDHGQALQFGLHVADAFQRLFPLEFAAGARDRPATLPELHLVAAAFLGLVHERLFEIDDNGDLYITDDPMWLLGERPVASDAEVIYDFESSHFYFSQPRPAFYGLGVQSFYSDYVETNQFEWEVLPLAIWQLFGQTAWSVGYDIADLYEHLPAAARTAIEKLRPLPRLTYEMVDALLDRFTLDRSYGDLGGNLIRYAFGKTGNELADYTDFEYQEMHDYFESDWSEALGVAEDVAEAKNLAASFGAWSRTVAIDPKRELQLLSKQLHRLLAEMQDPPRPKTLATIFAENEEISYDNTIDLLPAETEAEAAYP